MTAHPISIEMLEEGHLLLLGTTGAGKTYQQRGFLERLRRAGRRVGAVDKLGNHWGLTLSADGARAGAGLRDLRRQARSCADDARRWRKARPPLRRGASMNAQAIAISPDDRLLTMEQVRQIVPKHRTTIYRWIAKGEFPAGHLIGPASAVWLQSEILDWVSKKIAKPPG